MFRKGSMVLMAGVAALAIASAAWADDSNEAKNAFALQRTGVDARALGMGNAYVGLANDAAAGYWNPAGLFWMSEGNTSLTAMYTTGLSADRFQNYIAVGHRFKDFGLAASWINDGIRDVQGYDAQGNSTKVFGNFENTIIASLGIGSDKAAFGFSIKGYLQNLASEQRNGIGFDAGVQFKMSDMITLGGVAQDLGGSLGPGNRLPVDFRLGVGITPVDHFKVGMDVEKIERTDHILFHGGAEYGVKFGDDAMAMLRGGVNDSHFNVGLGVRVSKLQADYAFTNERQETLGNGHRVSLNASF